MAARRREAAARHRLPVLPCATAAVVVRCGLRDRTENTAFLLKLTDLFSWSLCGACVSVGRLTALTGERVLAQLQTGDLGHVRKNIFSFLRLPLHRIMNLHSDGSNANDSTGCAEIN